MGRPRRNPDRAQNLLQVLRHGRRHLQHAGVPVAVAAVRVRGDDDDADGPPAMPAADPDETSGPAVSAGATEAGEVWTAVAARAKAVAVEAARGVRAATVVPRST